jgi:hypothetical protein
MPERSRNRKLDLNQLAKAIVDESTGDEPKVEKDPAAVSLGRRGGLVGGKARAAKLTPEERRAIAQKAAAARWAGHPER